MAKKNAEVEAEAEVVTPEVAEVETEVAAKPEKGVATVTWSGGVREFSLAIHGKDFKNLAAQFAAKFNGSVA